MTCQTYWTADRVLRPGHTLQLSPYQKRDVLACENPVASCVEFRLKMLYNKCYSSCFLLNSFFCRHILPHYLRLCQEP